MGFVATISLIDGRASVCLLIGVIWLVSSVFKSISYLTTIIEDVRGEKLLPVTLAV